VTCGGLCPGLNNVIREVTLSLLNHYKVKQVLGIRGGFNGLTTTDYDTLLLTQDVVKDCHHQGGSILGSSRGGFDLPKILAFLAKHEINMLYVIGGDGTHRFDYFFHLYRSLNILNIILHRKSSLIKYNIKILFATQRS
jgi:6-phosphofructokinase 1